MPSQSEMQNEQTEVLKTASAILENWPILKEPREAQVSFFSKHLGAVVARIVANQDRVEEVLVLDSLAEVVSEALQNAVLPEDVPIQTELSREDFAAEFRNYAASFPVRSVPLEQMARPGLETVPPEYGFVVVATVAQRHLAVLQTWDRMIGLSSYLQEIQNGSPNALLPTMNELRLLFFLDQMLELKSRRYEEAAQRQKGGIETISSQGVNLYG